MLRRAVVLANATWILLIASAAAGSVAAEAPLIPGCGLPIVFSGVGGPNPSTVPGTASAALHAFEAAIGGVDNGGSPPPQAAGFRTINWDAVKLDGTDFGGNSTVLVSGKVVGIPMTRFQSRGVTFDRVHAVANDGFVSVNPGVAGQFPAFSPANTFASFNDNTITVTFTLASNPPATPVPAVTRGFGAIFLDVETPNATSIEYFNGTTSLLKAYAPIGGPAQAEFLGVLFPSPIVTSVQITLGTAHLFNFDGTTITSGSADAPPDADQVALDDFVYAEPATLRTPIASLSGVEGQALTNAVVGAFTDVGQSRGAADFTATINWGDFAMTPGTVVASGNGCFNVSGSHTFAEEGTYTILITVTAADGAAAAVYSTAAIADAPLTASGKTVTALVGVPIAAAVASFTDADPNGVASDYTATIDWGDGSTSAGTIASNGSGGFDVTGTHTYSVGGAFPLRVVINDVGGSTATASGTAIVTSGGPVPQTTVGNSVANPNSSVSLLFPAPYTDVDLASPVTYAGNLTTATFGWSNSSCSQALKIKFFRPSGQNLVFLAERGPFDSSPTTVTLSPPVPVQPGDLIGISHLTNCGNPVGAFPGAAAGYIAFGGDVASTVALSSGTAVKNFTLAVQASGVASESAQGIVAVVASIPGVPPSLFKTGFQMYNSTASTIAGRLVFHPQGVAGSGVDPSLDFSLAAGQTRSFDDLLPAMGLTGPRIGSLDIVMPVGTPAPVVAARVYNDGGARGTTGFTMSAASSDSILGVGDHGVLFAPADLVRFRMNIGVRSGASGAVMTVTRRDAAGAVLQTLTKIYAPNFFEQITAAEFLAGSAIGANDSITIQVASGSAIAYGATADNTTQDPSIQFATKAP